MQGHPEPQRGRSVTVRPHVKVQLNGDVFRFMASLGYRHVRYCFLIISLTGYAHSPYQILV